MKVAGRFGDFARISDEADRREHVFHFCPDCGSQVFYTEPTEPDLIVVSVGSFADRSFPPPTESGYDSRRHHWVGLPDSIQRHLPELWDSVRPLYDAGRYADAADKGLELIEAAPTRRFCTTTWRAARASRAGQATPSGTYARRSACGRPVAKWRRRTPTSIRSGTSPLSKNWSARGKHTGAIRAGSRCVPDTRCLGPTGARRIAP